MRPKENVDVLMACRNGTATFVTVGFCDSHGSFHDRDTGGWLTHAVEYWAYIPEFPTTI